MDVSSSTTVYNNNIIDKYNSTIKIIENEVSVKLQSQILSIFEVCSLLDSSWKSIDKSMIIRSFLRSHSLPNSCISDAIQKLVTFENGSTGNAAMKAANTKLFRRIGVDREMATDELLRKSKTSTNEFDLNYDLDFLKESTQYHYSKECVAFLDKSHWMTTTMVAMQEEEEKVDLFYQSISNSVTETDIAHLVVNDEFKGIPDIADDDIQEGIEDGVNFKNALKEIIEEDIENIMTKLSSLPFPDTRYINKIEKLKSELIKFKMEKFP